MTDPPKVTIGITAFNNEHYLPGALDGLLAQDYTDFEVVVCDNQSTDATWEILEAYAAKDNRFRIFKNPSNIGHSASFERVVGLARGEYFQFVAHDDLIGPTTLGLCVEALDRDPSSILAYTLGTVIDADGNVEFECEDEPDIHDRTPARRVAHSMKALRYCNALFGAIRLETLRRTKLRGTLSAGDNRLIIELAARGGFALVPVRGFFRRTHEQSSYGSGRSAQDRIEWLEPTVAAKKTMRHGTGIEWWEVTVETVGALARADLPLSDRVKCIAVFGVLWARRWSWPILGRWKRRLLFWRRPTPVGPAGPLRTDADAEARSVRQ